MMPEQEARERAAVVAEALEWQGTPYRHMGRVKGLAADCGQFPLAVFEAVGLIPHTEPEFYPHDWHLHRETERWLGHCERFAARVEGPPLPGDLALFKYGRCISHGAIVVEWPTIVHAHRPARCVCLDDAEGNQDLAARLVGFWSYWAKGRTE